MQFEVLLSNHDVPDSDNLAHIQMVVIQLGDEDGCHRLIQCRPIHVDGGPHREDEAGDPLVDAIVLLGTSEGDRQGGRAEGQESSWLGMVFIYK